MDPLDDQQPVVTPVQRGPGDDDELQSIIEQMHAEKKSKDSIDAVIRVYEDEKHPIRAAFQGGTDGVVKGLMGAVSNTWDTAKGVVQDALSMAHGGSPENAKALVDGMADLPRQWNEGGVRERAELLGNVLAGAVPGVTGGAGLVKGRHAIARTVGGALEYAGEHPLGTRLAGGSGIVAGIATGHPELAVGGLAATTLPKYATKLGQNLRIYGGENAGRVRLGEKGYAKTNSAFDEAMVKRGMEFYDEQKAAEQNAVNLQNIENMKEGRVQSPTAIRESVSAKRPNGSTSSASRSFDLPDAPDPTLKESIDKAVAAGQLRRMPEGSVRLPKGPIGVTQQGAAPSIRIVGKAAADLAAEPGIVPNEGVHAAPPVIDPAAQAVRDQTAPMGKAASDIADGKIPMPSHAPMPSDARMEELAGKLGGQPKPAKVPITDVVTPTTSKRPKANGGVLTEQEQADLGFKPGVRVLNIDPEVAQQLNAARASRHITHHTNAQSDRRFGTTRDDLKSILEQSLLMNMDRLR